MFCTPKTWEFGRDHVRPVTPFIILKREKSRFRPRFSRPVQGSAWLSLESQKGLRFGTSTVVVSVEMYKALVPLEIYKGLRWCPA